MRMTAGLALQGTGEIVGVVRQVDVDENNPGVVLVGENERTSRAAHRADSFVSFLSQHARQVSADQAVGDHDQDARAQFSRHVTLLALMWVR